MCVSTIAILSQPARCAQPVTRQAQHWKRIAQHSTGKAQHLTRRRGLGVVVWGLLVLGLACCCSQASAQNSSLFQRPVPELFVPAAGGDPFMGSIPPASPENGMVVSPVYSQSPQLTAASWTYTPPASPRVLRVHDVISIRVDEMARMTAEGRANQRKNATYDALLKNWLMLDGLFSVSKAPLAKGEPQVTGQLNEIYRTNSDVLTRESLAFNIAAEIADIRPNGNIVLEAHKTITINDNRWAISLSGICQAKDIGPDNVVLSKDILDLKIDKREQGQARDGYRRGWFTEWFSRLQPF
jgi:flagellar L-ring protein FlgH